MSFERRRTIPSIFEGNPDESRVSRSAPLTTDSPSLLPSLPLPLKMSSYTISHEAYLKIILHAAKVRSLFVQLFWGPLEPSSHSSVRFLISRRPSVAYVVYLCSIPLR
jgi:hypothetical protein